MTTKTHIVNIDARTQARQMYQLARSKGLPHEQAYKLARSAYDQVLARPAVARDLRHEAIQNYFKPSQRACAEHERVIRAATKYPAWFNQLTNIQSQRGNRVVLVALRPVRNMAQKRYRRLIDPGQLVTGTNHVVLHYADFEHAIRAEHKLHAQNDLLDNERAAFPMWSPQAIKAYDPTTRRITIT